MLRIFGRLVKWTLIVLGAFSALSIALVVFFDPISKDPESATDADSAAIAVEPEQANEMVERENATPEIDAIKEAANASEDERKGFHCLSSWDGSHAQFKRAVKSTMREPGSFEHVETRVTPVSQSGDHSVIMKYRARNGFGGMNVGTAIGTYKNSDCSFVVVSVE